MSRDIIRIFFVFAFIFNMVVAQTYSFSEQFSSEQGDNQWFYLYGFADDYKEMQWQDGTWHGNEEFLFLQPGILHPGENSDAIVAWLPNQAGTWQLTGQVKDANDKCGDGVEVVIQLNTDPLWNFTIENGDKEGSSYELAVVLAIGDAIIYRVTKRGANPCDSTAWNIEHVLQ